MSAARAPGVLRCLLLLCLADLFPRVLGMRRALRLVQDVAIARDRAASPDVIAETARRVALAAAFYPRRTECLEQSLALLVLLRRRGVPAEFRLGVRPRPFTAHAWVEVAGEPVNDTVEHTRQLQPFPLGGV